MAVGSRAARKRGNLSKKVLITTAAALSLSSQAGAEDWNGAVSSDWFNSGNWTPGSVPSGASTATIDDADNNPVLIDTASASVAQTRVGVANTGALTIQNGGDLTSSATTIGSQAGSSGTVTVTGSGSTLNGGSLTVGVNGAGSLDVLNGGYVSYSDVTAGVYSGSSGDILVASGGDVASNFLYLGTSAGASGAATISGAGSTWTNNYNAFVGYYGDGDLTIEGGGAYTNPYSYTFVGSYASSATGSVLVSGAGSTFSSAGIVDGYIGVGDFTVEAGADATTSYGYVGYANTGTAEVTGAGSTWANSYLYVGSNGGTGTLAVSDGGAFSGNYAYIGNGSVGSVTVSGGGSFSGSYGYIGNASTGSATVTGAGSTWTESQQLFIGSYGNGSLTVSEGGAVGAPSLYIAQNGGSTGLLTIGATGGGVGAGSVTGQINFGSGDGDVVFNHNTANYTFGGSFDGGSTANSLISFLGGETRLNLNSTTYAGASVVENATLILDTLLGGTVDVGTGGVLTGGGAALGDVTVDGGTLAGADGQTLGLGSLTLLSGAIVDVTLGAPSLTSLFDVTGNLTLDGALAIQDGGGLGAGLYRLFDYGGALTDNGLSVVDTVLYDFEVQTGVANQVNLLATLLPPTDPQFWNGGVTVANNAVNGGAGVWDASATNWTDGSGVRADAWASKGAIFAAAPGAVSVVGAHDATFMQFFVDGYALSGGTITLVDPGGQTEIRVGDGTGAGASYSAEIGSTIAGTTGLEKTDLGTLILSGDNIYTGGTTISAGTLQIGAGGTTGSILGDIVNNASLVFDRSDALTVAGAISGSGDIAFAGGAFTLTGNSAGYLGDAELIEGSLFVNGAFGGDILVSGGALGGTGSVGGLSIAAAATIAPGASIGTLNAASASFAAGSIFQVEVNALGQSDLLDVAGAVTISGGTVQVLAEAGDYDAETTYTILTGGSVGGAFDDVTSDLAFLDPLLSYQAGAVLLTMTRNDIAFLDAAQTPNQESTAAALDAIGAGPVWDELVGMNEEEAQDAFDALSGEVHAGLGGGYVEPLFMSVESRMAQMAHVPRPVVLASLDGGPIGAAERGAMWGRVYGGTGDIETDGNAAGLEFTHQGVAAGIDWAIGQSGAVGVAVGYRQSQADQAPRRSEADVDAISTSIYGGGRAGALSLSAEAGYAWRDISTTRRVTVGMIDETLTADYSAGVAYVHARVGVPMGEGATKVEPFLALSYVRTESDGFTESGGTAALTSGGRSEAVTFTTLGAALSHEFESDSILFGSVGWRHASGDILPRSSMAFASDPGVSFNVAGAPIAEDSIAVDAGMLFRVGPNSTIAAAYRGDFGDESQEHAASLRFALTH